MRDPAWQQTLGVCRFSWQRSLLVRLHYLFIVFYLIVAWIVCARVHCHSDSSTCQPMIAPAKSSCKLESFVNLCLGQQTKPNKHRLLTGLGKSKLKTSCNPPRACDSQKHVKLQTSQLKKPSDSHSLRRPNSFQGPWCSAIDHASKRPIMINKSHKSQNPEALALWSVTISRPQ